MKATFKKLIEILLLGDVWIENCQLKPISNFEEEIWVERLFVDASNLIKVQYREVDKVDAPRFVDNVVNLFKPAQIKHLLELCENQPDYSINITGSGTKGDIVHALERLLEDVKKLGSERFRREILRFCKTKGTANYWEAYEIMTRNAIISDEYYNEWLSVKVSRPQIKV